jgi:hypothetical protein
VGCEHTTGIVDVCLESSRFRIKTSLDTHPKDVINLCISQGLLSLALTEFDTLVRLFMSINRGRTLQ